MHALRQPPNRRRALFAGLAGVGALAASAVAWKFYAPGADPRAAGQALPDDVCVVAPPTPYDPALGQPLTAAREVPEVTEIQTFLGSVDFRLRNQQVLRARAVVAFLSVRTQLPIIGVGGIMRGDDARAKIKIAADQYPFRFIAVTAKTKKAGGGWSVESF